MKRLLSIFAILGLLTGCTLDETNDNDKENSSDKSVHVTGVSLDRTSVTVKEGESVILVPTITPDNADNKNVSWSSSNAAVAAVDGSGKVIGVKAGSATITATTEDGGMKATCILNVEVNLAPSVTVDATHVSAVSAVLGGKANLGSTVASDLIIGFQYSKSEGILPSNATTIEVSDADADYNYSAAITGLEPATTYYFRSFVRQNSQDTYGETKSFTTKELASMLETIDAVDVETAEATLNAKLDLTDVQYESVSYGFLYGQSEDAINTDYECTEIKKDTISAVLTNLPNGTQYWYKAYVQLDSQTLYGEVKTFTTVQWVTSISLSKTSLLLMIGEEETISVTNVLPDNANDKTYTWSSSDNSIATVDNTGKISAKARGNAVIKATANDGGENSASCAVRVMKNPCPPGAVDLGLCVYWATCNLSESGFVSSPEVYGDYYAWGETETKSNYSWSTYKFGTSSSGPFSKYITQDYYGAIDNKTVLDPEDDAVHVKLGGSWRMPTNEECTALLTNCTWTWTTNYNGTGVAGVIMTSNIEGYKDKNIFLPAAGYWHDADLNHVGGSGTYWSSTLYGAIGARGLYIHSYNYPYNVEIGWDYRYLGESIRPVSE